MPAINFQQRFGPAVMSGRKRQTIRAYRKRPFVAGDKLYLYRGMRTKKCELLRISTASQVSEIHINNGSFSLMDTELRETVTYEHTEELENLAHDDGFDSWVEMRDWFRETHGLPFIGQLIKW